MIGRRSSETSASCPSRGSSWWCRACSRRAGRCRSRPPTGFSRLWPSVAFFVLLAASMAGLMFALKTLPVGSRVRGLGRHRRRTHRGHRDDRLQGPGQRRDHRLDRADHRRRRRPAGGRRRALRMSSRKGNGRRDGPYAAATTGRGAGGRAARRRRRRRLGAGPAASRPEPLRPRPSCRWRRSATTSPGWTICWRAALAVVLRRWLDHGGRGGRRRPRAGDRGATARPRLLTARTAAAPATPAEILRPVRASPGRGAGSRSRRRPSRGCGPRWRRCRRNPRRRRGPRRHCSAGTLSPWWTARPSARSPRAGRPGGRSSRR